MPEAYKGPKLAAAASICLFLFSTCAPAQHGCLAACGDGEGMVATWTRHRPEKG